MVAAQRDQLLTDRAAAVGFTLAGLGVADYPLHLVAGREAAVRVTALARVYQRLDAPLDGQLTRLLHKTIDQSTSTVDQETSRSYFLRLNE